MTETVDSTRLREHIEVGRNAWEAMRSLTADETFDVVTELLAHRELLALRQTDTRIEGGGEKCPECGKPLAECEAGYADAFAAPTPEHVEGDVLGVEKAASSAILDCSKDGSGTHDLCFNSGLVAALRAVEPILTSATTRIQRAEREIERLRSIVSKDPKTMMIAFEDGDHMRLSRSAGNERKRADLAEAQLADAVKAIKEAAKGLDMVHNGLMDPTRPRQAVGEVCAHFLTATNAFLSTIGGKPDAE